MLKSYGWWGGVVGGPCDYCVSPSPKNWVFGFIRLGLTLGSGFGACWGRGLGTWTRAWQFWLFFTFLRWVSIFHLHFFSHYLTKLGCIGGLPAIVKRRLLNCIEPIWFLKLLKNASMKLFRHFWLLLSGLDGLLLSSYCHLEYCCLEYCCLDYCCLDYSFWATKST